MKQVTQSLQDGVVRVVDVPVPAINAHSVLVRTAFSLISAGTERTKIELGRANLVEKARRRPRDVQMVLSRIRRDGLLSAYRMVRTRLAQDDPLGYSAAGVVEEVGEFVTDLRPGDLVACGGAGYANHAEFIAVPGNLCARVPEGVGLDQAAYATAGAIALQGFRQTDARVGDWVAVIGLGLLGQLTVCIARAAGCRVLAVDLDERKVALAASLGAEAVAVPDDGQVESTALAVTDGLGVDAVIITAATKSSGPIAQAGQIARDRGVVVVVGDVPIEVPRSPYYEKELSVRLSRSYGPGRYDPAYEEYGIDYPEGYVKWTERRNMEEFLRLAEKGAIDFSTLTTHRFSLGQAPSAYEAILDTSELVVGALLVYDQSALRGASQTLVRPATPRRALDAVRIGLIGAGNFATGTLLPALKSAGGVEYAGVVTAGGLSAGDVARRFGFEYAAADAAQLLKDESVDAVVIATRHDSHAELVIAALQAGKSVFVEKPLALSADELVRVVEAWRSSQGGQVLVGFNRRFAPHTRSVLEALPDPAVPRQIVMRVNAGALPDDHWTKQIDSGGGRIVGEVCHFVDLACCLAGDRPYWVYASSLGDGASPSLSESVAVTLTFLNGSVASISYTAVGDPAPGKELVEVHCGGRSWMIDDFRVLTTVADGRTRTSKGVQDKGHTAEMAAFIDLVRNPAAPTLHFQTAVESTLATLAVIESLCTGRRIEPRMPSGAE